MNLATLAQIKQYLGITDSTSDAVLNALITAYSARVAKYCGREFNSSTYQELRNGNGQYRMLTRQWPVTAISALIVDTGTVPATTGPLNAGFRAVDASEPGDGRLLVANGYRFNKGYSNVQINYTAGYLPIAITGELWNIPASPFKITLVNSLSYIGGDTVIHTVGGVPFTRVAGNPTTGQYSITSDGILTFAAADTGVAVTIGYNILGFPGDLTQAVVELVGLRYRSRGWIGFKSKTLATETIAFDTSDMPDSIKQALAPFQSTMIPQ